MTLGKDERTNLVPGCNKNAQTRQWEKYAWQSDKMVLWNVDPRNEVRSKDTSTLQ